MLSKAQNDLITQTDAGTPAGKFLRSYWQPIATADEMPIGGAPMPVKIMGEELVLFRDDKDRLGLIGLHCAHRGTDLSYGRVENGGLRCLYHGWLFDIEGKCIDQPAEPDDKKFCHKVRQTSYPVQEKGGAIWTFMGEGEPPLIPEFGFLNGPETHRHCFRVIQNCNWLQGLESSTDPAHTTYLHRIKPGVSARGGGSNLRAMRGDDPPKIDIEHTSFGTRIFAIHKSPNGRKYMRVNNFVFPNGAAPATSGGEMGYQGRWYVPIDDHSHCRFEFFYRHSEPLNKEGLKQNRAENVGPDLRHIRRIENRYLQDRNEQKNDDSFTGMGRHFPSQDAFAIETQGTIQDRTNEHLGSSDVVIIEVRKALFKAIKQMQDTGEAPGVLRDAAAAQLHDFVCVSTYIEDHEDGPAYCRRVLSGRKTAAE